MSEEKSEGNFWQRRVRCGRWENDVFEREETFQRGGKERVTMWVWVCRERPRVTVRGKSLHQRYAAPAVSHGILLPARLTILAAMERRQMGLEQLTLTTNRSLENNPGWFPPAMIWLV